MKPRSARHPHTALVLLRQFVPLDVFFKVAIWWAFVSVMELSGEQRDAAIRAFIVPALVSSVGFWVATLWAMGPVDRLRRGAVDDAALRAAAAAAYRGPLRVALISTLSYSVAFGGGALVLLYGTPGIRLPPGSGVMVLFIEAIVLIGATTLGYLRMMHSLARPSAALSLRLMQRGLELPIRPSSLRHRNLLFGLGVGLSPVAFLTGMSVVGALRSSHAEGLLRAQHAAAVLALHLGEGGSMVMPDGAQGAVTLDAAGAVTARLGAEVPAPLLRRALAALAVAAGRPVAVDDGRQMLGVARGGGTLVAVALPDSTRATSLHQQFWIVFVVMIVYAFLCARYLSNNMLFVVHHLARALRDIAEAGGVAAGTKRIPVLARDELGALVESANLMIDRLDGAEGGWRAAAQSLREANLQLEQRVEERTAALRDSNRELEENLKRLLEARSKLAEAARAAGMAEVASSVLHNVGNVLNSVNVSAQLVADRLRGSKVHAVKRALAIVPADDAAAAAFFAGDGRGRALPRYLRLLGDALVGETDEMAEELGFLQKNIEHIKVIVSLQQAHAKQGGLIEPVRLGELCEDALRFGLGSVDPAGITVVRELDHELEVLADRHRLFQIVVNLVRNARDALRETDVAAPCIHLRARRDGADAIVEVADNGCGISPEDLTRIFNLGFTTKPDGHGFGLHSSALAAGELGGALGVRSEGIGRGATFMLRLPCQSAGGDGLSKT